MQVTMTDIPMKVWDAVSKKWTDALIDGWDPDLWNGCALCEYMMRVYGRHTCEICPLNHGDWCRSRPRDSRLNITYHVGDDGRWAADVEDFLKYIKPYCSEDIK